MQRMVAIKKVFLCAVLLNCPLGAESLCKAHRLKVTDSKSIIKCC